VTQQLRIFFLILVGLGLVALVDAQAANRPVDGTARVKLGQSVVALNGPWKFQAADSPLDPRTGGPLWAEPGFDDSKWETVDLTSGAGELDPINGCRDMRRVGRCGGTLATGALPGIASVYS
jgi:hypothetical protein